MGLLAPGTRGASPVETARSSPVAPTAAPGSAAGRLRARLAGATRRQADTPYRHVRVARSGRGARLEAGHRLPRRQRCAPCGLSAGDERCEPLTVRGSASQSRREARLLGSCSHGGFLSVGCARSHQLRSDNASMSDGNHFSSCRAIFDALTEFTRNRPGGWSASMLVLTDSPGRSSVRPAI